MEIVQVFSDAGQGMVTKSMAPRMEHSCHMSSLRRRRTAEGSQVTRAALEPLEKYMGSGWDRARVKV